MVRCTFHFILLAAALFKLSVSDAQEPNSAAVLEALFAQVESLGLEKTYYIREQEARPPSDLGDSVLAFPSELLAHSPDAFGQVRVSFVDESFLSGLWEGGCRDGWARFHERYPEAGDLTQVSRVIFDGSRDRASVYLEQGSGCRFSCGGIYELVLQADVWTVIRRTAGWCS